MDGCVSLQQNDLGTEVDLRASFKYATKLDNSATVSSSLVREASWNRFVFIEMISATLTVRLVQCFLWMTRRTVSFSSWSKRMDATAPQSYTYELLNIQREFWTLLLFDATAFLLLCTLYFHYLKLQTELSLSLLYKLDCSVSEHSPSQDFFDWFFFFFCE